MIIRSRHHETMRNRQDGFTVLELMVVIAVIGALAAASYASMVIAERPAVHQAVNYLMADLITARNEAIKGEESCIVNFDFAPVVRNYTYNLPTSGTTKTVFLGDRFRDQVFFLPGPPGGGGSRTDKCVEFQSARIPHRPSGPMRDRERSGLFNRSSRF